MIYLYRIGFPLPSELSNEHWTHLMTYDGAEAVVKYLDAVITEKIIDEKFLSYLKEVDAKTYAPLTVDEDHLKKILHNDPKLEVNNNKAEFKHVQTSKPRAINLMHMHHYSFILLS